MQERIHAGCSDIRILLQIEIRIEERMRITPFACAVFEIMTRRVDGCIAKIWIGSTIPNWIQQGRFVKYLDFFGQAPSGFSVPQRISSEDAHNCYLSDWPI